MMEQESLVILIMICIVFEQTHKVQPRPIQSKSCSRGFGVDFPSQSGENHHFWHVIVSVYDVCCLICWRVRGRLSYGVTVLPNYGEHKLVCICLPGFHYTSPMASGKSAEIRFCLCCTSIHVYIWSLCQQVPI